MYIIPYTKDKNERSLLRHGRTRKLMVGGREKLEMIGYTVARNAGFEMPTDKQIDAAAAVAIKYGCNKAHAQAMAKYMLLAAEAVAPIQLMKPRPAESDLFDDWPKDYHEQFWALYPNKVGRGQAFKILDKIHASHKVTWTALTAGLATYIDYVNESATLNFCHPTTWLNGERWSDQFAPEKETGRRNGFAGIVRENRGL